MCRVDGDGGAGSVWVVRGTAGRAVLCWGGLGGVAERPSILAARWLPSTPLRGAARRGGAGRIGAQMAFEVDIKGL